MGKFCRVLQWKMYTLWTVGLFYGHLVYFKAIWSILRTFGTFLFSIFCGNWVYLSPFGNLATLVVE
jgi:hypothetical protein